MRGLALLASNDGQQPRTMDDMLDKPMNPEDLMETWRPERRGENENFCEAWSSELIQSWNRNAALQAERLGVAGPAAPDSGLAWRYGRALGSFEEVTS